MDLGNKKTVLYVGTSGFPFGLAQVERQKLIAKGLTFWGCNVTVLSRYGIHNTNNIHVTECLKKAIYEGINFEYTSGSPFVNKSFLRRNFLKIKGLFNEIAFINEAGKKDNKVDALLITTNNFYNVIIYCIISYFRKIPTVLDNVEYWSSHKSTTNIFKRIDNFLYDNYASLLVSKVLCISDYLVMVARDHARHIPIIKIPTIVDFANFPNPKQCDIKFFLFCGSAAYFEVIQFIITAFENVRRLDFYLYLVCNGNSHDLNLIKCRIERSSKKDLIKVFSKLKYNDLIELYASSMALLIPLRNSVQDSARFPHKIGEYCAARRPIIATNNGEIKKYFTDGVNAFLAADYDPGLFSETMTYVIENPCLSEKIGNNSYNLGKASFDYLILTKKIYTFIFGESPLIKIS